jgi:hypothetical protein
MQSPINPDIAKRVSRVSRVAPTRVGSKTLLIPHGGSGVILVDSVRSVEPNAVIVHVTPDESVVVLPATQPGDIHTLGKACPTIWDRLFRRYVCSHKNWVLYGAFQRELCALMRGIPFGGMGVVKFPVSHEALYVATTTSVVSQYGDSFSVGSVFYRNGWGYLYIERNR